MTLEEARFPTQIEEDRREAFDPHDHGFPHCGWLYWHRSSKARRKVPNDLFAPYADPITGGMRPMTWGNYKPKKYDQVVKVSKEVKDLTEKLKGPKPERWSQGYTSSWCLNGGSELDPITVRAADHRVYPAPSKHDRQIKLKAHNDALGIPVEKRPIPESLMVNREVYLAHIRDLMREWGLTTDKQFNIYREHLIRFALNRMGLL